MLRNIILIIVIILEQIGVSAPFSWDKVNLNTNMDSPEGSSSSFIEEISPLAQKVSETEIILEARSFISLDAKTAKVLTEKDSKIRIPMASITKIMTAIVILENAKLDDIVTISQNAISTYGTGIGLRPGERLTVNDLMYATLLNSSNDSAVALAEHVSGTEEEFAKLMNEKVKELNLSGSHFTNAAGLDNPEHYSTVSDLALLTRYALQNPTFREIVKTKEKQITSLEGISHNLKNSNKLMGTIEYNILGVKTGYTEEAGECLITLAENDGNEVLAVVLNTPDRFGETRKLLKWSFNSFKW